MSEAERKAFVDGARYGWDVENRATRTWQVDAEALRRYPDAPPPGDGGLREELRDIEADCEAISHDERYEQAERRAWHSIAVRARAAIRNADAALGRPAQTHGKCGACDGSGHRVDEAGPYECTLCHGTGKEPAETQDHTLTPSEGGDTTFDGKPPAQGCDCGREVDMDGKQVHYPPCPMAPPAPRPGNAPVEGTTSVSSTKAISNASGQATDEARLIAGGTEALPE